MMNIHIIFNIQNKPTGGGNQFLKALKNYFVQINSYTENPNDADIFLFNSYQYIKNVIKLKKKYPDKLFVHRIDGPIRLYSKMSDKRDDIINTTNKYIADATIFQSEWSKEQNLKLGLNRTPFDTTIINAPDKYIFNKTEKKEIDQSKKIRLIATSWSSNKSKGFSTYKWLDDNLDFSKYDMTFCGNSPVKFKNIKHILPLPEEKLAKQLKLHDIFITASQKDPCSNSLTEALHCGLPAIALNDGGHPEIIKNAGKLFTEKEEIPNLISEIITNYNNFVDKINLPEIDKVAQEYNNFFETILTEKEERKYAPKKLNMFTVFKTYIPIYRHKIQTKLNKTNIISNTQQNKTKSSLL